MDVKQNKLLKDVPERCLGRVRGLLFFDRKFDVTQNKTEFIQESNPFWKKFMELSHDDGSSHLILLIYTQFYSPNTLSGFKSVIRT
jgi:hypothetical protein